MAAFLKSRGDMYQWIDFTWNPVQGPCEHHCEYCYVQRINHRFGKDAGLPRLYDPPWSFGGRVP
jgi:DNA repair photolyase